MAETGITAKEKRRKIMQRIRSKDTKAEVILRKALWHRGIRYRKNYKGLPGKPDIAITKYRIAVFVDGDFWHARGHEHNPGEQIKENVDYWTKKLRRNVERDREVNENLLELNWIVLRFWESDISKDLSQCVEEILAYLSKPV